MDDWRMSLSLWPHRQTPLRIQLVRIGAYREEVSSRLDRCKSPTRHFNGSGTSKAFDRSTHRSLKLIDFGRSFISGIDILLIPNHRQWNKSVANRQRVAQGIQSNPQVVGVKESMPLDILKGTLIFFSTLRRLAQKETSIPISFRQMPPFTLRRGSSRYFHQKRCPTIGKVMQEREIQRRAQVIGIGNEEKLLAVAQQRLEKT